MHHAMDLVTPHDGHRIMTSMKSRGTGRLLFVGAVHEAAPALHALIESPVEILEVVTLPIDQGSPPSGYVDLEPLAAANGIPVRRITNINSPQEVEHVNQLAPDVLVVVGWTRLLGADILAIPPRGCIGFHASLLPRYRGRAPVNWAILRGERQTGNTMMFLDVGTDTGDIIDQRAVAIEPADNCATVYSRVADSGAAMLRDNLPAILNGTASRRPQGPCSDSPLPKRIPAMGITDWNRPARAVHDWIRSLTAPYPGAFAFWAGHKVMLWASATPHEDERRGPTGEVIGLEEHGVRVGTADGSLLITSMSDEGRSPQPAIIWARDIGLQLHDRFEHVNEDTALWALGLGDAPVAIRSGAG
jgi:methionyl-tRNA formyltransferase